MALVTAVTAMTVAEGMMVKPKTRWTWTSYISTSSRQLNVLAVNERAFVSMAP